MLISEHPLFTLSIYTMKTSTSIAKKFLFELRYYISTLWLFCLFSFFSSCEKQPDKQPLPSDTNNRVFIINEGNFQFGNASIDVYLPDSQTIFKNIYKTANNKNLGDVAQSAVLRDKKLFTVVNNSSKISVISSDDYKEFYTISLPGSSPRYIQFVNDNKAFVSELYAKKIWIINPANSTLIDTISTEGWTEQMALIGNELFVAQRTRLNDNFVANVLVINTNTNKIAQTISLPSEPNSMAAIGSKIWILCSGGNAQNAKLLCVNSGNKIIEREWEFNSQEKPMLLRKNESSNEIFWYKNGVFKMSISDNALPVSPIIQGNNRNIYALDINEKNGDIYLADAIDYVQSSSVFRYKQDGTLIQNFKAGIITSNFIFE